MKTQDFVGRDPDRVFFLREGQTAEPLGRNAEEPGGDQRKPFKQELSLIPGTESVPKEKKKINFPVQIPKRLHGPVGLPKAVSFRLNVEDHPVQELSNPGKGAEMGRLEG